MAERTLKQVESELVGFMGRLRPLQEQAFALHCEAVTLRSLAWIKANSVLFVEVELSSGGDKPYFDTLSRFVAWLRSRKHNRRFCEWDGRIYCTEELLAGRMENNASCRMIDLEGADHGAD